MSTEAPLPSAKLEFLRRLLAQVEKTTVSASASLDRALAEIAESEARIEAMEQAASQARSLGRSPAHGSPRSREGTRRQDAPDLPLNIGRLSPRALGK